MPVTARDDVDESLAALLASGRSQTAAAEECGISTRTVYRRLEDPTFRAMVDRMKRAAVSQAIGTLTKNMNAAAITLCTLMADADDEKTRFAAAREIIAAALRSRAQEELETTIADLTERLVAIEKAKEKKSR